MTTSRRDSGPQDPRGAAGGGEQAADLSSLYNFPSLGRLVEGGDARALEEMRERLTRTGQELERVVRQGPKEDADRAARAARAVTLTVSLLDTLEGMRRQGGAR